MYHYLTVSDLPWAPTGFAREHVFASGGSQNPEYNAHNLRVGVEGYIDGLSPIFSSIRSLEESTDVYDYLTVSD